MGLRTKLLLAASALVLVPIAGYQYLISAQSFLRDSRQQVALSTARAMAHLVRSSYPAHSDNSPRGEGPSLRLTPLGRAPQIDGDNTEWPGLIDSPDGNRAPGAVVAATADSVYLLLTVAPDDARSASHLRIEMSDGPGDMTRWQLPLSLSEAVSVREVSPTQPIPSDHDAGYRDDRFRAGIGRDDMLWVVEISFPVLLLGQQLRLSWVARDGSVVGQLPDDGAYQLMRPQSSLLQQVRGVVVVPGRRIWFLDRAGRVLAREGEQPLDDGDDLASWLLMRLLPEPDLSAMHLDVADGRVHAPEVDAALGGREQSVWRRVQPSGTLVVSAAAPVGARNDVLGAVVVEDTMFALAGLHARGLVELTAVSVAAFAVAVLILLAVSARLVSRLRALRDAVHSAFDAHGRVSGKFEAPVSQDELGDLGRSFEAAIARIQGYNDYLEQLSRRLSHEFRTPLSIVRSSLENLSLSTPAESKQCVYIDRAQTGIERLDTMLRRMGDATRLEQAVQDDDREVMDLNQLVTSALAATADAWPQITFESNLPAHPVLVAISPMLVIQALEKLIANAIDFHLAGTAIRVDVRQTRHEAHVVVVNHGPLLKPTVAARMFESMVSERNEQTSISREAHLGLGLHIVRLVARGHGGDVFATNLSDESGVEIGFYLPIDSACN